MLGSDGFSRAEGKQRLISVSVAIRLIETRYRGSASSVPRRELVSTIVIVRAMTNSLLLVLQHARRRCGVMLFVSHARRASIGHRESFSFVLSRERCCVDLNKIVEEGALERAVGPRVGVRLLRRRPGSTCPVPSVGGARNFQGKVRRSKHTPLHAPSHRIGRVLEESC